jgi:hypothetical protein
MKISTLIKMVAAASMLSGFVGLAHAGDSCESLYKQMNSVDAASISADGKIDEKKIKEETEIAQKFAEQCKDYVPPAEANSSKGAAKSH